MRNDTDILFNPLVVMQALSLSLGPRRALALGPSAPRARNYCE